MIGRHLAGLLLAAACLLPAAARAEVKDAAPAGFTLENAAWVPASPEATWHALVDEVGRWWPADHTWWGEASRLSIRAEAGGCFCEMDGARQAQHMVVSFAEPGKLLRMAGGLGPLQGMGVQGVLEWRLAAENGGTRIVLWYRVGGYTPQDLSGIAPVVDRVQALQLGGLARHLGAPAAR